MFLAYFSPALINKYKYFHNDFSLKTTTQIGYFIRSYFKGGSSLNDFIRERAIKIGEHILETKDTIRKTAEKFGVNRSTVYRDITERLPRINKELADQVQKVIEYNKTVRHIRGGEATRKKYINT